MNKLQESVDFISAKFEYEYEKDKKQKKEKRKILEGNNLKMHNKIAILEKQIHMQQQYSRRNCILPHVKPKSKGEVTDDIAVKTIC